MSKYTNTATMSTKGQITVPKNIRKALSLREGSEVVFTVTNDVIIAKPLQKKSFLDYAGTLKSKNKFRDFHKIREETMNLVAKEITKEGFDE